MLLPKVNRCTERKKNYKMLWEQMEEELYCCWMGTGGSGQNWDLTTVWVEVQQTEEHGSRTERTIKGWGRYEFSLMEEIWRLFCLITFLLSLT